MGKLFPEVSGQVVTLFAFPPVRGFVRAPAPNFCFCTRDTFVCSLNPDSRICPQFKSCTVTNFWLRDNCTHDAPFGRSGPARHCASASNKILYRDSFPASIKLVPPSLAALARGRRDTLTLTSFGQCLKRVMLNKICTMTAKSAPHPPCLTAQTGRLAPRDARFQLGQGHKT